MSRFFLLSQTYKSHFEGEVLASTEESFHITQAAHTFDSQSCDYNFNTLYDFHEDGNIDIIDITIVSFQYSITAKIKFFLKRNRHRY